MGTMQDKSLFHEFCDGSSHYAAVNGKIIRKRSLCRKPLPLGVISRMDAFPQGRCGNTERCHGRGSRQSSGSPGSV